MNVPDNPKEPHPGPKAGSWVDLKASGFSGRGTQLLGIEILQWA